MKSSVLAGCMALALTTPATAQSLQSGSVGGMPYYLLPASNGCSSGCSMVTYLPYMGETQADTASDVQKYFGSAAFQAANPNTVVVAPMITQQQSTAVNWGGYDGITSPQQAQMVAVVKAIQTQNNVDTSKSVVTGGSLGGDGTQASLIGYGPKGLVQPGVFSAGLSFDAATYAASGNSAAIQALCGVPLMAVHGTNDGNQNISYDQSLNSALSSCGSFTLKPIQGAGHGTWNAGYSSGVGAGTPLGWLSGELSGAKSGGTVTTANAPTAAPTASPQVTAATPATQVAASATTITPGSGQMTDAAGNVWNITENGSLQKNGQWVEGAGGTAALTIENGVVFGLDAHHDQKWWNLSDSEMYWTQAANPPQSATTDTTQQAAATAAPIITQAVACTGGTGANATGAFYVANGQIIAPNGMPFIAKGINLGWTKIGEINNVLTTFPGINMIRVPVGTLNTSPNDFRSFVNTATSQGIVVEIEYHPWPIPNAPSGGDLNREVAWVTKIASAFANNPYVWLGTQNEPQGGDVSGEHLALYKAIRGTGNNNPLMMMLIGGGNPGTLGIGRGLNASAYAGMKNVVWDYHKYAWSTQYSTDQHTIEAAIASSISLIQQITSADGVVPVIIGEYGNGVIESEVNVGGKENVAAVINMGATGKWGSLAWIWQSGSVALSLINSDNTPSTPYGQMVALYIGKDRQACTVAEAEQNTQSAVAQISAQVTAADTSASPAPSTTPTQTTAPTDTTAVDQLSADADAKLAAIQAQVAALQNGVQQ